MTITWRRQYLMGLMPIVISLMVGCSSLMGIFKGNTPPPPAAAPDHGPFEYALSVYEMGDYKQAANLFNALSTADSGHEQHLRAQFGEICCRLMLADSPEDVAKALGLWKKLKNTNTGDTWRVEQTLFEPLIARLSVSAGKPSPAVSPPPPPKQQTETELTTLKKKAAQVPQLQRQLDTVTAENQTLKEKIKALEAIDQSIQKKKTEISAPSE